jgi:hypothetical protein
MGPFEIDSKWVPLSGLERAATAVPGAAVIGRAQLPAQQISV